MKNSKQALYPAWLQHAMTFEEPVRVTFADFGSLQIDKKCGVCQSEFDFDSLPLHDGSAVVEAAPYAHMTEGVSQSLDAFLWTVQLRCMQQRLANQPYERRAQLVQLVSWPDLTRLPEEIAPLAARVCALLAYRRATSGQLLPTLLNEPAERVCAVVEVMHVNGHISVVGEQAVSSPEAEARVAADAIKLTSDSIIVKLWNRLQAGSAHSKKPLPVPVPRRASYHEVA